VKSGFATFVGRPNVGKSTLLNAILGEKVSIVAASPQTTRTEIRGVLNWRSGTHPARPDAQVVFVDTPGIHKPRTTMGERLNATADAASSGVDVVCFVIDATAPLGKGDRFVAGRLAKNAICVVNKVDIAERNQVLAQLTRAGGLGLAEYFPISALTGEGVEELVAAIVDRLPEGPQYYPEETVTDQPDEVWVAELVREQLLAFVRDELPHSIACRVTEYEWPRIRVEIVVERDSQKGIVIGKGGLVLKQVGQAVRAQLREGAYIELMVKVDPDWQRQPKSLDRLGY